MNKNRKNGVCLKMPDSNGETEELNNNKEKEQRPNGTEEMDIKVDHEEIRRALVRHWTGLDRARLHTFHLWLFVYACAQIFLFNYLCHRVSLWSSDGFLQRRFFVLYYFRGWSCDCFSFLSMLTA